MKALPFWLTILLFCISNSTIEVKAQSGIKSALSAAFHPMFAKPQEKEMGQFQMSVCALNRIRLGDDLAEVAFVLDGTQSMAGELPEIRKAIPQLYKHLSSQFTDVRFSLVLYRDFGAESKAIEIPTSSFVNVETFEKLLAKQSPDTGKPFFPEFVDQGIYEAITKLQWSSSANVQRMMFLIGDAPPYEEEFDFNGKVLRKYSTNLLVQSLVDEQIQTFCWLCAGAEKDAFQQTKPALEKFMRALSVSTGGQFIDLTDQRIQAETRFVRAVGDVPVVPMSLPNLSSVAPPQEKKRLAVIPVEEIQEGKAFELFPRGFSTSRRTNVEYLIGRVPRIIVLSDSEVARLRGRLPKVVTKINKDDLQGIASKHDVDGFIFVTGKEKVFCYAKSSFTSHMGENGIISALKQVIPKFNPAFDTSRLKLDEKQGREQILEAAYQLDQASRFPIGDANAENDLAQAEKLLSELDNNDAMGHYLLAQLYFTRSLNPRSRNPKELAAKARDELRVAYNSRSREKLPSAIHDEIEADYSLIIEKDFADAIDRYSRVLQERATSDATRRRSLWMLAGIRAGDWGAPLEVRDLDSARGHFASILREWPNSREGMIVKAMLPYGGYPLVHELLAGVGGR